MKIIGTGSALPQRLVTNFDLEKIMDTSDEWISTRTGIRSRHIATTETTTSLAIEAAKKALEAAQIDAEELDMIIAASVSSDKLIPMLSCQVQAELGAVNAFAFDINAACSGFIFSLGIVDSYMRSGRCKKALILGAENLSKIMDWEDRSTCVLFGDGAGAAVLSNEGEDLIALVQGSDGPGGMALSCDNRPLQNPYVEKKAPERSYVHMDGQAVYKFAVKTVPKAISQALEQAGMVAEDIDIYLLHQANLRIIESISKRLKVSLDRFPTNLEECGNVSAASIPILLDFLVKHDKMKQGQKIALAGFGAGLTWGAAILTW